MSNFPTHRNKATGDIVFWGDHLDPNEHELLPKYYFIKEHEQAIKKGIEKGNREAKFKGWTIEELGVYFEDRINLVKRNSDS